MADKQQSYGVLEGVLAYAKIAQADTKYQSKDTEYSVQVIVDEDTADTWEAQFKKQPAKKIKASEFESKYKFECPIKGAKNVYAITLRRDATKDGEPFYPESRPKVFLDTDEGRLDITESRLIANGSRGKVSYRVTENSFGTFAKLANVLLDVDGFIEYESKGGGAGSEFGESKPVTKEPARKEATAARKPKEQEPVVEKAVAKKPSAPKQHVAEDDDDTEAPF